MQDTNDKNLYFRTILGNIIKDLRLKKAGVSCNKFANEYGLNDSNLGKIERALIDCKFITLWKLVEALGVDFGEFVQLLKQELGEDFKFIDE